MSNLKDSSQLLVEEADKHFALVVLLGERENHAAHRRQQLEGANLIHVLLTEEEPTTVTKGIFIDSTIIYSLTGPVCNFCLDL